MAKRYDFEEVADTVHRILNRNGLMDTSHLGRHLKGEGIDYTHRTLLKKLQRMKEEYEWLDYYFSNGYLWYIKNPTGLANNQDIFAAILIDEYQTAWVKWLGSDPNSNDKLIYSAEIEMMEKLFKRLTNIGLKIDGWERDEDRCYE